MKHVIHIFGASGSGTSTLGKKICAETGYHFIDTDDYFWLLVLDGSKDLDELFFEIKTFL